MFWLVVLQGEFHTERKELTCTNVNLQQQQQHIATTTYTYCPHMKQRSQYGLSETLRTYILYILCYILAVYLVFDYGWWGPDTPLEETDDGSSPEIIFTQPLKYYGVEYNSAYVSVDV